MERRLAHRGLLALRSNVWTAVTAMFMLKMGSPDSTLIATEAQLSGEVRVIVTVPEDRVSINIHPNL